MRTALLLDEDHARRADHAAKHGVAEETSALVQGLKEKAEKFRKSGGEICRR